VALFVGTPTALFAVVALFLRGLVPAFLRVLVAVVILIMLRTPLNHLLYVVIPGFDSIKPLARVSFLLCFAVAALAAYGLDRSIRVVLARWNTPTAIASLVAVACACIAVVVWQAKDLAREDLRTQDPAPSAMYPGTPLTDHLASLGSPRILPTARMLRGSTAMVSQVESAIGYESLIPRRVARFWEVVQGASVAQASSSALNSAYYPLFSTDNIRYDLLARAGVSYVAAIPGEKLPARGAKALHGIQPPTVEYSDTDGQLFRLAGATGLATVVHSCQTAPSELAALRTFTDDGFRAASTVLLEQPVSSLARYCNGAPSRHETATLVSDGSNSYRAHATLRAPGMLLIRVNAYPGWHATVDGKSTPLVAADYLYQAIPLSAGTHDVKLTFAPRSLRVGAAISLATLLILLGTLAWSRTQNRRRARGGSKQLAVS
jgi:hypothetical protein